MSDPIRIGVLDSFGKTRFNPHGSQVMAGLAKGIRKELLEHFGYPSNISSLGVEYKDINEDGCTDEIHRLDLDNNGTCDIEIIGINGIKDSDPTIEIEEVPPRNTDRILDDVISGKFGKLDYLNFSLAYSSKTTEGAKALYDKYPLYKKLSTVAKNTPVYTGGNNSNFFTYNPTMFCDQYQKNLHIVCDTTRFNTIHDISVSESSALSGIYPEDLQGYDIDADNDAEILHPNPWYTGIGNSIATPFFLGREVVKDLINQKALNLTPKEKDD